MNRFVLGILGGALILAVAFGTAAHLQQDSRQNSEIAWTAPYRDGMYLANLDHQLGKKPHLRTGRWSSNADRAAFVAGYEQISGPFRSTSGAELEAFRRGVNDGAEARQSERPFSVKPKVSELAEGQSATENDVSLSYVDGYQLGYYSDAGVLESRVMRRNSDAY